MDEPAAPKKSSEYTLLSNTSNRYPTCCSIIILQIYDIQQKTQSLIQCCFVVVPTTIQHQISIGLFLYMF